MLDDEPILSFPGLDIYPRRRKVFRDHQEIRLTHKEYEILLLLVTNKGWVLTYNQIYEKVWNDFPTGGVTPLGSISTTYGKSCTRQLPMLPLLSDLSGKLDTALKYKQINKSQQSDPFRLLFFFSAVNPSYNGKFTISCHHARCHLSPKGHRCPLAEGGIFTRSRFPDLKKQSALSAPGTVPLLSNEKLRLFQILDCPPYSRC